MNQAILEQQQRNNSLESTLDSFMSDSDTIEISRQLLVL